MKRSTRLGVMASLSLLALGGVSGATHANLFGFLEGSFKKTKLTSELTVYNNNMALVKEVRSLDFVEGTQEIVYDAVPNTIIPSSVAFRDLELDATTVLEQTFHNDMVSRYKLLQRHVGKEVVLTIAAGEKVGEVKGTLLSASGDLILKTTDGIESYPSSNLIAVIFENTDGMHATPSLIWRVNSAAEGSRMTETSYLADGLTWSTDYVVNLSEDGSSMDLASWATLENNTSAAYSDVVLNLVAGDVNRDYGTVSPMRAKGYGGLGVQSMAMEMMADESMDAPEQSLADFHMYSLGEVGTIAPHSQKQLSLLGAESVDIEKKLVYPGHGTKLSTVYSFDNEKSNNLGVALPAGTFRVYAQDENKSAQFVGEASISHTAVNEEVEVRTGTSFDVVAEYKNMDGFIDENITDKRCTTTAKEVTFKNRSDRDEMIVSQERVYGREVEILDANEEYTKENENLYEFEIEVAGGKEKTLTYSVRVCY